MSDPRLPSSLSVVVVDDHPLVRQGLRCLLSTAVEDLTLLEAGSVAEALEHLERRADAWIVDLALPGRSGIELIEEITAARGRLPILAVSMYGEAIYAERALRAGASGYVMKEEGGAVLLNALARVLAGEVHLSETMALRIAGRLTGAEGTRALAALTPRESEVWRLLGEGLGTRKIASRLAISPKTVETHCYNIRRKTGIEDAAELIHAATRWVLGKPLRT